MPSQRAQFVVQCQQDPDCQSRIGTHAVLVPGQNNYPLLLESLSSDTQAIPGGKYRVNLRIVVTNPTDRPFGPFQMVVSPAVLRQGQPILPPPVILVEVESLAPGATGVFFVEGVEFPGPEGGKFHCLDRDFKNPSAPSP